MVDLLADSVSDSPPPPLPPSQIAAAAIAIEIEMEMVVFINYFKKIIKKNIFLKMILNHHEHGNIMDFYLIIMMMMING